MLTDSNIKCTRSSGYTEVINRGDPMETVTLAQLQQQHADLCSIIYREGIFTKEFINWHRVQRVEPNFLKFVADSYSRIEEIRLNKVATMLQEPEVDYRKLHEIVVGFRGSFMRIGLRKVVITCDAFITCYRAANFEGCVGCLKHLKDDYYLFKRRLGELLQLGDQIVAAGGTYPIIEYPHQRERMLNPKCHRVSGD